MKTNLSKGKNKGKKLTLILTGGAFALTAIGIAIPIGITEFAPVISYGVGNTDPLKAIIKKEVVSIDSVEKLFENDKPIEDLTNYWQNYFNTHKEIVIENYNDFINYQNSINNLTFNVQADDSEQLNWIGKTEHVVWSRYENIKKVLYSQSLEMFNIKDLGDLQKQLRQEGVLKNILDNSGYTTNDNYTYNLGDSQIYMDTHSKKKVEIHVKEKDGSTKKQDINLILPISDINVSNELKVSANTNNDPRLLPVDEATVNVKYNIGINQEATIDGGIARAVIQSTDLNPDLSNVDLNQVLDAMYLTKKSNEKLSIADANEQSNNDVNNQSEDILDDQAISSYLNIYNVDFTDATWTDYKRSSGQSNKYTGDLTFEVIPTNNHHWEDGSIEKRSIKLNDIEVVPGGLRDSKAPKEIVLEGDSWKFTISSSNKNADGFKDWWMVNKTNGNKTNAQVYQEKIFEQVGDQLANTNLKMWETAAVGSIEGNDGVITYTNLWPANGHEWTDGITGARSLRVVFKNITWN